MSVLTNILSKSSKNQTQNELLNISSIFSQKIPTIIEPKIIEEHNENVQKFDDQNDPLNDPNASALQIKDRASRTVFVGNICLTAKKNEIAKFFKKFGEIEKLWERSVPINEETKLPTKANVIKKNYKKDGDHKNCYILFKEKESALNAMQANNELFMQKPLRVDFADQKTIDYETTIFIGNLPFDITEDELRKHFKDCGEIINVRVIRDPQTHIGKGFGYIYFRTVEGYKNSLAMNFTNINNRQIRVRKALDPEQLEAKKQKALKKETRNNAERRLQQKGIKKKKKISHDDLKRFVDNNTIDQNEVDNMEYKNIVTLEEKTIKRKMKKMKNNNQAEKTSFFVSEKSKMIKKHDKNLFNDINMMKKRKETRKKKKEYNTKKSKLQKKDLKK